MAHKNEAKLEWLRAVFEGKSTLFGAFSDTLTKDSKRIKWTEVHILAQTLGLVPPDKTYKYTRDTFWQNMRKAAVKKRDNSRQTGSGQTIFTKIDEAVYGIIGRDTPTLDGLLVSESLTETADDSGEGTSTSPITDERIIEKKTPKKSKKLTYEEKLKLKKLQLTVKYLEKKNYLVSLEIKRAERDLGVVFPGLAEEQPSVSIQLDIEPDIALELDEEFLEDDLLDEM